MKTTRNSLMRPANKNLTIQQQDNTSQSDLSAQLNKATRKMSTMSSRLTSCFVLVCLLAILQERQANCLQMHKSNYKQQFSEADDNDDRGEDFSQLAASLAVSAAVAASGAKAPNPACERISIRLCSSMGYNFTRPGNFFGDQTQIEAAERAQHYEELVRTQCSRHLLAYLCELLVPVCIENDSQKRFEIFPCRPFCRKVKSDCDSQIRAVALSYKLDRLSAFDCEALPYKANGGEGPCHELPDDPVRVIAPSSYKPFDPQASNVPPFITDNSPLDPHLIRPRPIQVEPKTTANTLDNTRQQQPESLSGKFQSLAQQLAIGLSNYSNLLCVLTLICLVLVINAKRLKRIKNHLRRRSSGSSNRSSSSSSNSSGNSRRKLAAMPAHKFQSALSPSSSSRSLVLVATDGKRGQPKHKLLQAGEFVSGSLEPSKKLLQAGLDRRTLININGTLERQKQQHNNAAARYHLMQSMGLSETPAIDSKHQYDYIQVSGPQHNQQQHQQQRALSNYSHQSPNLLRGEQAQVYNNILLSSPSHQVLLFGDGQSEMSSGRPNFMTTAAADLSGQYADPTICSTNSPNRAAMSHQSQQLMSAERQRSFQRRPSHSNSSGSSRFQRVSNTVTTGGASLALGQAPLSSNEASSSSSSSGSSASSFSPPESSSGNLLLGNQFVQSSRRGF